MCLHGVAYSADNVVLVIMQVKERLEKYELCFALNKEKEKVFKSLQDGTQLGKRKALTEKKQKLQNALDSFKTLDSLNAARPEE